MAVRETLLPKKYHEAVLKWQRTFLPDLDFLLQNWDKHFSKDKPFKLCAYRQCGVSDTIEVGEMKGCQKFCQAKQMNERQAHQLLGAVRAQASTEFGSIQQHRLTLARAQEEQDQFWVLRMMAEELRHGYQMLHLLLEDDWESLVGSSGEEMVEEILSMRPGSHVLGAFNIEFDSFVDNVVFCALIDRVGKYQLAMQQISAYKPMAESMPPMLREEAFHLATGVIPLRRWIEEAARGEVYVTVSMIQKALNKWLPRGLEMFGDERGGATNIKLGFKDKTNLEACEEYLREVDKLIEGLNKRYLQARFPELSKSEVETAVREVTEEGTRFRGLERSDLLLRPDVRFFRRRGQYAYQLVGFDGTELSDFDSYRRHLAKSLPESYLASSDFRAYLENLRQVCSQELTPQEAAKRTPSLAHVGGACPCSKSVRWVGSEEEAPALS